MPNHTIGLGLDYKFDCNVKHKSQDDYYENYGPRGRWGVSNNRKSRRVSELGVVCHINLCQQKC